MKISIGPSTILHPHPVLVVGTYDAAGKPNFMTASWGGICCSEPPCVAVSLRKATHTYHSLMHSKAFTIGIPSKDQVAIIDFLGIASGKNHDKAKEAGLTVVKSDLVEAPYALQFPFSLECKLVQHFELGLHTQFIGEIVDIKADQEVLNEKRAPDIEKTHAILYGSSGSSYYYAVGERLGKAFSIGKQLMK